MSDFLADTTILVEHLRGNPSAKKYLEEQQPSISSVTIAELIQGSRNSTEQTIIKKLINDFAEIKIDEDITSFALSLLWKFYLSHGITFLDTLIAASAIKHNLTLVTGNVKHFIFLKDLKIKDWKEFEKK